MMTKQTAKPERRWPITTGGWLLGGLVLAISSGAGGYWVFARLSNSEPIVASNCTLPPPLDHGVDQGGAPWFQDMQPISNVQFTYQNGEAADQYTILETLGGGIALLDYDCDGLLDLFVTGGGYFDGPQKQQIKGHPCRLYRNMGDWKFVDVTTEVQLERVAWGYSHGIAVADYDRDGWPDLLVTGYGKLLLFHNESDDQGGRRFSDVTESLGLGDDLWSTSAGWADIDGDGFPDLYVCHYVDWSFANNPPCRGSSLGVKQDTCGPEAFKPLVHALFRNEQGKAFRNTATELGFQAKGCGLGVVLTDLNDDGRPDIYVGNDTNHNFLYFNRGGGKLDEKGLLAGVAGDESGTPDGSMGVDAADYDGSGKPSLWVTNFAQQVHGLYLNLGQESFHHQSRAAGVAAMGRSWVSFGTSFLDLENDGWEDLVIVSGHVWRHPVTGTPNQRPILLHNEEQLGRRFFTDVSSQGGQFFQTPALGRGLAIGDLDNDGLADIVVSNTNSPVDILRNESAARLSKPNRWLGVKLSGRDNRDVVGSTVIVEGSTRKLTRFAKGGGSYLSANDSRLLFGLGETMEVLSVTVKWAWGESQTWSGLEPNRYWALCEGEPHGRDLSTAAH